MPQTNKTILILTNETVVGEIIQFRLQLLGFDCRIVCNDQELEEALQSTIPHLAIIDLDITCCDALQLIERISSDEVLSVVPVLCMSGRADMDLAEKAFRAGAREYLLIPFDPVVLEQKVERSLELFAQRTAEQSKDDNQRPALATTT